VDGPAEAAAAAAALSGSAGGSGTRPADRTYEWLVNDWLVGINERLRHALSHLMTNE